MYPPLDSSVFGFSLTATTTGMEISPKKKKSCSLPCHRPPQADPCHSAYTAPSGCFHQTQSSAAGTEGCDTVGVGTESLFYCSTHCKMLRTSTSAEWLWWKCDTRDVRTVSTAHTAVSEKKKKRDKVIHFVQKPPISDAVYQPGDSVPMFILSSYLSHILSDNAKGKEEKLMVCSVDFGRDTVYQTLFTKERIVFMWIVLSLEMRPEVRWI